MMTSAALHVRCAGTRERRSWKTSFMTRISNCSVSAWLGRDDLTTTACLISKLIAEEEAKIWDFSDLTFAFGDVCWSGSAEAEAVEASRNES